MREEVRGKVNKVQEEIRGSSTSCRKRWRHGQQDSGGDKLQLNKVQEEVRC